MDIRPGQYAFYKDEWAYVIAIHGNKVWLSGWHGIKTTVVSVNKIKAVKDKPV